MRDSDQLAKLIAVTMRDWNLKHKRPKMEISQAGIDFIKHHEGCELVAYRDQGGVLTIGYGHTGKDFDENTRWTQAQCEAALRADLVPCEDAIHRQVTGEITQNQYDALCSFCFNLGVRAFSNSSLLRYLNAGEVDKASAEFRKWDHIGQIENTGLLARREAEAALFMEA